MEIVVTETDASLIAYEEAIDVNLIEDENLVAIAIINNNKQ